MLGFVGVFYYLPNVNDFIVEILIGSVNSQVMHVLASLICHKISPLAIFPLVFAQT